MTTELVAAAVRRVPGAPGSDFYGCREHPGLTRHVLFLAMLDVAEAIARDRYAIPTPGFVYPPTMPPPEYLDAGERIRFVPHRRGYDPVAAELHRAYMVEQRRRAREAVYVSPELAWARARERWELEPEDVRGTVHFYGEDITPA